MKSKLYKITGALLAVAFVYTATSFAMKSPLEPWIKELTGDISVDDNGAVTITSGAVDGTAISDGTVLEADLLSYNDDALHPMRVAKGSLAFATLGAGAGAGSMASGITLPAGAIVVDGLLFGKLAVQTTTGNPTFALGCSDDVSEFLNATFFGGLKTGSMTAVKQVGTSATATYHSAACPVFATIASGSFSQGILDVWLQYYLAD